MAQTAKYYQAWDSTLFEEAHDSLSDLICILLVSYRIRNPLQVKVEILAPLSAQVERDGQVSIHTCYFSILYYTMLYYTIPLCYTILYYTAILYYTILYYIYIL
jgi:hypothetical protein